MIDSISVLASCIVLVIAIRRMLAIEGEKNGKAGQRRRS